LRSGLSDQETDTMSNAFADFRAQWTPLTLYQRFEHVVVLILSTLIAIVVVAAVWHLMLKIAIGLLLSDQFDPTDHGVFQAIFGMIFTVIIALEFKRSLVVLAERKDTIVQVRTVILIAILAVVRKLIILDLTTTNAQQLFALAAAILALGAVYWLVRDQDRRRLT
jgi:uncharacterized membrane protein (DUF373 family)